MSNLIKTTVKHKTKFLALCLWLGIFVMARTTMATHDLSFTELADQIVNILRDTWYGSLLFIILYISRPLLLMPGTILLLTAGMVYGFWLGVPIAVTAELLSATITYTISRWFISSEPKFEGRTGKFVALMRRNPFETALTMQLSYISTDLISSMAGILHLPLRSLLLAVLTGGSVGSVLGVMVGSTIEGSIATGNITIVPEMILISFIILITMLSLSTYLRRRNLSISKDATHVTHQNFDGRNPTL
jgi:uncharacterized membrane protein YdjX (TVP38/TMEM64 family)